MQKMNKYNAKIDVIQSDNVYNKGKSITEKSEILHLKEIVKGTCKVPQNWTVQGQSGWSFVRKCTVPVTLD